MGKLAVVDLIIRYSLGIAGLLIVIVCCIIIRQMAKKERKDKE